MNEIEKLIQETKNERNNLKKDVNEKMTLIRIREAELRLVESFIDELNGLKHRMETIKQ